MIRTLIILCHDCKEFGNALIEMILPLLQSQNASRESEFFMCIKTNSMLVEVNKLHEKEWLTSEELSILLISFLGDPHEKISSKTEQDLPGILHDVADTQPYLGATLRVIFIFGACREKDALFTSFLPVAGALKRLIKSHNSEVLMTSLTVQLPSVGVKLSQMDDVKTVKDLNLLHQPHLGWTGNMLVMDKCESKGVILTGCQLHCSDWSGFFQSKLLSLTCPPKKSRSMTRKQVTQLNTDVRQPILGRSIEVLQIVNLETFPLFLLDSWTLLLTVQNEDSVFLINFINKLHQTGLLARLRLYADVKEIPVCSQLPTLSTNSWKEKIIANDFNLLDHEEFNVASTYKYIYFLLLPHDSVNDDGRPSVRAQVLLSPFECDYTKSLTFGNTIDSSDESQKGLEKENKLFIQADKFQSFLELFTKNYKFQHCTQDDLMKLQKDLVQTELINCDSKETFKWILENSMRIEERIMEAKESSRKGIENLSYLDSSTSLLSPPAEKCKNLGICDFSIDDVLKNIKQKDSKIPLSKMKGRGLCRFESQPDFSVSWPNSQQLLVPDVYKAIKIESNNERRKKCISQSFYKDDSDLMFENKYARIRDQSNSFDTRSSFLSPLKKKYRHSHVAAPGSSPLRSSSRLLKNQAHRLIPNSSSLPPNSQVSGGPNHHLFSKPANHTSSQPKHQTSSMPGRPLVSPKRKRLLDSTKDYQANTISEMSNHKNHSRDILPKSHRLMQSESFQLHTSPRKTLQHAQNTEIKIAPSKTRSSVKNEEKVTSCESEDSKNSKMKRSQRHKLKLQSIIHDVLSGKGVKQGDKIFDSCARNLFNVSMVLLKTYTSSRNLTEEMKNVVCGQVDQIISLELRRSSKGR